MPTKTPTGYVWSKQELEYLDTYFQVDFNKDLAKHFGVSLRILIRKARELKLEKHELFRTQLDFVEIGRKASTHPKSIATRFKKGIRHSPETEFKPKNYAKITTTIC
jgi:hypothetical protein